MRTLALAAALALAACSACSEGNDDAAPSPSVSRTASPGTSATPSGVPSTPPSPAGVPSISPRPGTPRLQLVGRFVRPLHVVAPPGDTHRLFVVEQEGRVMLVKDGRAVATPFLDIRGLVGAGGERGLLSVAFSPDYATDRRFYVDYTNVNGDTVVAEYTATDPDRADPRSGRVMLFVDQPYANHNGGLLVFDRTGMLIVGLGDGGSGGDPENRAQNLGTLLGKLLRIDPHPSGNRPYGVPRDNPFVGRDGARGEIWAYGVRNPWRFSFDPGTGDLYLGDVGQNRFEELNVVPPAAQSGANYGWRAYEGNFRFKSQRIDESRLVRPVLVYGHDGGRCSITGGHVYRGVAAALRGRYLYADVCAGRVWSVPVGTARDPSPRAEPFTGASLVSFGEDAAGEQYLVSLTGDVWRITV